jgi:hypothetical protein
VRKYSIIFWFRVFLLVTSAMAGVVLVISPFPWVFFSFQLIILITGTLFLWVISDVALSLRRLQNFLETSVPEVDPDLIPAHKKSPKDPSEVLLDMANYKRLGDRTFKADGTKTCRNCKSLKSEELLCLLDGASLQGITISAVGCQHWQPALKVTGTPDPTAPNGTSKRPVPHPPQQEA